MIYYIYIKSHCEAPDYEDTYEANSKKEASVEFHSRFPAEARAEWSPEDLIPYIASEDELSPTFQPI